MGIASRACPIMSQTLATARGANLIPMSRALTKPPARRQGAINKERYRAALNGLLELWR